MNDINSVFGKFEKENSNIREIVESEEYKLSRVVAESRIMMDYTQHQFAELCNVSDRTIHRLEGGDKGIDEHDVNKVLLTIVQHGIAQQKRAFM